MLHGMFILQVFVVVLSPDSVQSAEIKDEMALAYISSTPIYPLSINWYPKIAKAMESGMYVISTASPTSAALHLRNWIMRLVPGNSCSPKSTGHFS